MNKKSNTGFDVDDEKCIISKDGVELIVCEDVDECIDDVITLYKDIVKDHTRNPYHLVTNLEEGKIDIVCEENGEVKSCWSYAFGEGVSYKNSYRKASVRLRIMNRDYKAR